MSLGETQRMQGILTIEVLDAAGAVVERRLVRNLITTAGKRLLADLLMGKVDDVPNKWFIGVGVGDAEPQAGDTKLQTRVYEAEATSTVEVASVSMGGGNVVRATVKAQLPPLEQGAEPQPLVEAGIVIITDKDKETLFNRAKFAQVNRSSSVVMNLAWEISF